MLHVLGWYYMLRVPVLTTIPTFFNLQAQNNQ